MIPGSFGVSFQLTCFLNCGDYGNDRIHVSELEEFQDAWAHSGGNKPNAFVLAPDIMPDDHAQSRRIHVGNVGQVEDVNRRLLAGGQHQLQIEHLAHGVG